MSTDLLEVGGLQVTEYSGGKELRLQFTIFGLNGHVSLSFDQVKELQTALWWWCRRQVSEAAGYNDPLRSVNVEAVFLAKAERDELIEHRAFLNELRTLLGIEGGMRGQLIEAIRVAARLPRSSSPSDGGDRQRQTDLEAVPRSLRDLFSGPERGPSSTSNAYRPGSLAFALQQLAYELQTAAMRASNVEAEKK
jgi:hypothetical protein